LFQLAKVHQDVWELAVLLGQSLPAAEGQTVKLKPLTLITTFCSLVGLSNNEKLQLLTALYKGELEVGQIETKACEFKVWKQVEAAFAADARKSVQECVAVIGRDVFDTEVNCWITAFSHLGKGKALCPPQFTNHVHTLLHAMTSCEPQALGLSSCLQVGVPKQPLSQVLLAQAGRQGQHSTCLL